MAGRDGRIFSFRCDCGRALIVHGEQKVACCPNCGARHSLQCDIEPAGLLAPGDVMRRERRRMEDFHVALIRLQWGTTEAEAFARWLRDAAEQFEETQRVLSAAFDAWSKADARTETGREGVLKWRFAFEMLQDACRGILPAEKKSPLPPEIEAELAQFSSGLLPATRDAGDELRKTSKIALELMTAANRSIVQAFLVAGQSYRNLDDGSAPDPAPREPRPRPPQAGQAEPPEQDAT